MFEVQNDIHTIVEAKPFVLTQNAEAMLMQMGIEMLAWNNDFEKRKGPKERFIQVVSRL